MALSHLSREIHRWQMDKEYRVKINTEFPAKSSTSQYLYYPRSSLPVGRVASYCRLTTSARSEYTIDGRCCQSFGVSATVTFPMLKMVAGPFATSFFGGVREVLRADPRRRPRCDGGSFYLGIAAQASFVNGVREISKDWHERSSLALKAIRTAAGCRGRGGAQLRNLPEVMKTARGCGLRDLVCLSRCAASFDHPPSTEQSSKKRNGANWKRRNRTPAHNLHCAFQCNAQ